MAVVTLLISLAAIVLSLAAFWKTHLSPFSAITLAGRLRLRIYPIRNENKDRWFIPSLDVPVSVTNEGARPGVIDGLRLRLHFPKLPIPGNCEFLPPSFEVNPANANEISSARFDWIDKIVVGEWMPFIVLSKATVTKHFIFESHWEEPVIQEVVDCSLEMRARAGQWKTVTTWHLCLDEAFWSLLTDSGSGVLYPVDAQPAHATCTPTDLHKYTGTKAQISKVSLPGPSRLDYP